MWNENFVVWNENVLVWFEIIFMWFTPKNIRLNSYLKSSLYLVNLCGKRTFMCGMRKIKCGKRRDPIINYYYIRCDV